MLSSPVVLKLFKPVTQFYSRKSIATTWLIYNIENKIVLLSL